MEETSCSAAAFACTFHSRSVFLEKPCIESRGRTLPRPQSARRSSRRVNTLCSGQQSESVSTSFGDMFAYKPEATRARGDVRNTATVNVEFAGSEDAMVSDSVSGESCATESLRLLEWKLISEYVSRFASTPSGRKAMRQGLPLASTQTEAEALLAETREVIELETVHLSPVALKGVAEDLDLIIKRASKSGMLEGIQLVALANTLVIARKLRQSVFDCNEDGLAEQQTTQCSMQTDESFAAQSQSLLTGSPVPTLFELVSRMQCKPELEREIFRSVDDFGDVRDTASAALAAVRREQRDVAAGIKRTLEEIMFKKTDCLQDKIVTVRSDRFVLSVKAGSKGRIRGRVLDTSASGSTLFIEPREVESANSKLHALAKKEKKIVEEFLTDLSARVGENADTLFELSSLLLRMDMAVARARHSMHVGAVEPAFSDSTDQAQTASSCLCDVRNLRHPVLVWQELDALASKRRESSSASSRSADDRVPLREMRKRVVPATYKLKAGVKCAVVTGPNTGGKTVTLKTLGTAVLMAKAGLFLIADHDYESDAGDGVSGSITGNQPRLPFYDQVLADIGDDQSIVQSLSTFSGHIERVKRILNSATSRSLVLLDEVGSGTDPTEGSALGVALLQHLASTAALTFATTHHGELKTLKYSDADGRFENASVEFDAVAMKPTYRLVWGIPGRSNALAIAERLEFPMEILESARDFLDGGSASTDVNAVIDVLESQRREQDHETENLRALVREATEMRAQLEVKEQRLYRREVEFETKKSRLIEREVDKAKAQVKEVLNNASKNAANAMDAKQAASVRGRLNEIARQAAPRVASSSDESGSESDLGRYEPKKGDMVVIARLGESVAEVVEEPNARGEVIVKMGAIRTKVKASELTMSASAGAVARKKKREQRDSARATGRGREAHAERSGENGSSSSSMSTRVITSANTVDVRGATVDEAVSCIESSIGRSLAMGVMCVIHGHGTGKLRRGLHEYLRTNSLVSSYEYADQTQGGTGATIVTFT